jgi:hypothetical protein
MPSIGVPDAENLPLGTLRREKNSSIGRLASLELSFDMGQSSQFFLDTNSLRDSISAALRCPGFTIQRLGSAKTPVFNPTFIGGNMASIPRPTDPATADLPAIRLDGVSLADVEKMESNPLKEALGSVLRQEASVADHQQHQDHSNAVGQE